MKGLELFISKIDSFESLSPSNQIEYFAYFLLIECKQDGFVAKQIGECFNALHLPPYSNIPSFLSKNSKGKGKKYLKKSNGRYYIERTFKSTLDDQIGDIHLPSKVHSDFFPIEPGKQ